MGIDGEVVGISSGKWLLEVGVEVGLEGQFFLEVVVDEPAEKTKTSTVLLLGTSLLCLHPLLTQLALRGRSFGLGLTASGERQSSDLAGGRGERTEVELRKGGKGY